MKGRRTNGRNYDDPAYKQWRSDVLKRDKRKCQFPGCNCKTRLQIHHILMWAHFPHLRYNIQNGITLCRKHHDMIREQEDAYIKIFHDILIRKIIDGRKDN